MTLQECTAILTPFVIGLRADFDTPTFKAYHRMLKDVAPGLLEAALNDLKRSGLRFMPSAPELLTASEKTRRRLLALHPYTGCAECEDQPGYRTREAQDGQQKTVERCPCKNRYLEKLEAMGAREAITLLPSEADAQEATAYPAVEQLPPAIRAELSQIAGRKLIR